MLGRSCTFSVGSHVCWRKFCMQERANKKFVGSCILICRPRKLGNTLDSSKHHHDHQGSRSRIEAERNQIPTGIDSGNTETWLSSRNQLPETKWSSGNIHYQGSSSCCRLIRTAHSLTPVITQVL